MCSLAEQIAALSDPRPKSIDPEDVGYEDSGAVLCNFADEVGEEEDLIDFKSTRSSLLARVRNTELEQDLRYGGRTVSRRQLEEEWGVNEGETGEVDFQSEEDHSESPGQEDSERSLVSDEEVKRSDSAGNITHVQSPTYGEDAAEFSAISAQTLKEDIDKGRAVKHQLELWDAVLETRIKLQKPLSLSNQFPQHSTLPMFQAVDNQALSDALRENSVVLQKVLDQLLDLQAMLMTQNSDTAHILNEKTKNVETVGEISDEEITSDDEELYRLNADVRCQPSPQIDSDREKHHQRTSDPNTTTSKRQKRRKKLSSWMLTKRRRDCEGHIDGVHARFQSFRDETIAKWNSKLRLASGRITSKSFIQSDQSALAQIKHILQDRRRLVKRTQLKRSVYRVLGKSHSEEEPVSGETGGDGKEHAANAHLMNYDEEIFDDDDFYHQLLRELINRKTSQVDIGDPVAVGRQLAELQKLKTKIKKKVDTKASKGRKMRYHTHQKLVGFMAPVEVGSMGDAARNDLFSSLFGARMQSVSEQL